MDRRAFLRASGLGGAALLAGCISDGETGSPDTTEPTTTTPGPTDEPTTDEPTTTEEPGDTPAAVFSNASFESELDGWTVGRDLPDDPNNDGEPVDSDAGVTDERASDGEHALELYIDGSQDDGTLWVEQAAPLDDVEKLTFDVYSPTASFNTRIKVAAYAGPDAELDEQDFDTSTAADGHEGWKTFEYDVDHDGEGLVAVGMSVVWETGLTGVIDNVRLARPSS